MLELLSPVPVRKPEAAARAAARVASGRVDGVLAARAGADFSTVHLLARIQQLVSEIKTLSRQTEAKGKPAASPAAAASAWAALPPWAGKLAGYSWAARALIFACGAASIGLGTRKGGSAGVALAAGGFILIAAEAAREAAWKWPGSPQGNSGGSAATSPAGAAAGAKAGT